MGKARWIIVALALGAGCDKRAPQPTRTDRSKGTALSSPGQNSEDLALPLAKIDDVTITLGDFQDRMSRQSPYVRARYTSLEQRKEFLDTLVRFEILAKEAYKRGLDKDPDVVRAMKQAMIEKLMREEFDASVTADSIKAEDMKAYYDANLSDFVKPEAVRASAIILKNRAQAERVAVEAQGDAGKTNKGFRELVTKYSADEETKLRGGDLRFFELSASEIPTAVAKAAFQLANIGDVSAAVDAGDGTFYVLKQTGRRPASTTSFEDAKPQIRNNLFRDRRLSAQKAFVEDLRAKAKIDVDNANLAKVQVDTSAGKSAPAEQPVHSP